MRRCVITTDHKTFIILGHTIRMTEYCYLIEGFESIKPMHPVRLWAPIHSTSVLEYLNESNKGDEGENNNNDDSVIVFPNLFK